MTMMEQGFKREAGGGCIPYPYGWPSSTCGKRAARRSDPAQSSCILCCGDTWHQKETFSDRAQAPGAQRGDDSPRDDESGQTGDYGCSRSQMQHA